MSLARIAVRNLGRNPFRSCMTVLGVAIGVLTFVMLHSVNASLLSSQDARNTARLYATNRMSWYLPMPKKYARIVPESVAGSGVEAVTYTSNFNGKLPSEPAYFFMSIAVDAPTFLDVFTEVDVSPQEKQSWLEDRQGALVGEMLAKKLGLKVGEKIAIKGTYFRGDWVFNVRGIYKVNTNTWDRSSVVMHWDFVNDNLPPHQKDQINWVAMRVPTDRMSSVASAIERTFQDRDVPLRSFSHDGLTKQIGAMFVSVVRALNLMSFAILAILTMILGNTIATGVRERTRETGMLRAVGFSQGQIILLIVGEAAVFALLGGIVGLGLAFPLVQEGLGRVLTEGTNAIFPTFRIRPSTMVMGLALPVVLGSLAALIPAYRALGVRVVDALRHVE